MVAPTHTPQNYEDQGGNLWVVGGTLNVLPGGYVLEPTQDGIVAHAGGGQANATQLSAVINRVTTVATTADSAVMPASVAGWTVTVINSGANALQLFGLGTDTINGVASGTGISVAAGVTKTLKCVTVGAWFSN